MCKEGDRAGVRESPFSGRREGVGEWEWGRAGASVAGKEARGRLGRQRTAKVEGDQGFKGR